MNKPTRTFTDLVMEERRRIEQLHGVSPTQAVGSRMLDAQTKDALQAVKHDEGKPRYDLVPPEALDAPKPIMHRKSLISGASQRSSRSASIRRYCAASAVGLAVARSRWLPSAAFRRS